MSGVQCSQRRSVEFTIDIGTAADGDDTQGAMQPHPYLTLVGQPEPIQAQGAEDQAWANMLPPPAMYFYDLHMFISRV